MSDLLKLSKAELINMVDYCRSLDHVADVLMQHYNQLPAATNYWCCRMIRENALTGEQEPFDVTVQRVNGKTANELLAEAKVAISELSSRDPIEALTEEQKSKIAMDSIKAAPLETIGHYTLLKLGEVGIVTGADVSLETEATITGKRFKLKMAITYEEIAEPEASRETD